MSEPRPASAPLAAADLDGARALVEEAGWNQVAADWRIFLDLGRGFAVRAPGGQLVATAATLPYPSAQRTGFGWISMVLVTAAWRRRGLATALLDESIASLEAAGLVPVLDATPAGRTVYRPLGFIEGWPITRWRRTTAASPAPASPAPATVAGVRALADADWPAILALDARAFGGDRAALLARLRERSPLFACVVGSGGRIDGFLLGRDGRVATQLGPIVAADASIACRLLDHACARVPGAIIVDALDAHPALATRLAAQGFAVERPYTRMALRRDVLPGDPALVAAIAGPELG